MSVTLSYCDPVQGCHEHCCSGYYRVEKLSGTWAGPSLTNSIHQIFTVSKFAPDMDRNVLDQSLRLATRLIEASLPFFHTLSHHDHRHLRRLSDDPNGRPKYEFYNEVGTLTPSQKRTTWMALTQEAAHISFELTDLGSSETDYAPNSTDVIVSIAKHIYTGAEPSNAADIVGTTWYSFDLARTLVHEMCHAFVLRFLKMEAQQLAHFFFSGRNCAEEGFEWETRTFGGMLDTHGPATTNERAHHYPHSTPDDPHSTPNDPHSTPDDLVFYEIKPSLDSPHVPSDMPMITITDWPNLAQVNYFVATNGLIGSRPPPLDGTHIHWNVDFAELHRLFTDNFWSGPITPTSLHFTKRTGTRLSAGQILGETLEHQTFEAGQPVDTTSGVPNGYRVFYHPVNGGTGLVMADNIRHPFGPDGFIHPAAGGAENGDSGDVEMTDAPESPDHFGNEEAAHVLLSLYGGSSS